LDIGRDNVVSGTWLIRRRTKVQNCTIMNRRLIFAAAAVLTVALGMAIIQSSLRTYALRFLEAAQIIGMMFLIAGDVKLHGILGKKIKDHRRDGTVHVC
jgi:hypothetical protein